MNAGAEVNVRGERGGGKTHGQDWPCPRKANVTGDRLAAEVVDEPEDEREGGAKEQAGYDREINCGVACAVDDVAGEFAEAEREAAGEVEGGAEGG